jgi:hypothetical protein
LLGLFLDPENLGGIFLRNSFVLKRTTRPYTSEHRTLLENRD